MLFIYKKSVIYLMLIFFSVSTPVVAFERDTSRSVKHRSTSIFHDSDPFPDVRHTEPSRAELSSTFVVEILNEIKKFGSIVKEYGVTPEGTLRHIVMNSGQTLYFDRFDEMGVPVDYRRQFKDGTKLVFINGVLDLDKSIVKKGAKGFSDSAYAAYITAEEEVLKSAALSEHQRDMQETQTKSLYSGTLLFPTLDIVRINGSDSESLDIVGSMSLMRVGAFGVQVVQTIQGYQVIHGILFDDKTYQLHQMYGTKGERDVDHPWLSWCLYGNKLNAEAYELYQELCTECDAVYAGAVQGIGRLRYNGSFLDVPIRVWPDHIEGTYELVRDITLFEGEAIRLVRDGAFFIGTFKNGTFKVTKTQIQALLRSGLFTLTKLS